MSAAARVMPAGDRALMLELADGGEVDAVLRLIGARPPGVTDLVPGARTLLARFDPARLSERALASLLLDAAGRTGDAPPRPAATSAVDIPVVYDGEDLAAVARELSVETAEVVRRHTTITWRAAFCGFAPGFAYLEPDAAPDGSDLTVPRLPTPRTRVPAGSVALADAYSAVYPRASPGGWRLIGRTDAVLFDPDLDPPALIGPGARVRFRDAGGPAASPPGGGTGGTP